jgi:DNA-binding PadR family transcriptional regulator
MVRAIQHSPGLGFEGAPIQVELENALGDKALTSNHIRANISFNDILTSDILRKIMVKQSKRDPSNFLPLTPADFNILLALADGEKHGYGIMQEITTHTGGKLRLGPGTLYGAIKRLLEDGLIEESGKRPDPAPDDERRRYYRLTEFGQRVAAADAARLEELVRLAHDRKLLPGKFPATGSK